METRRIWDEDDGGWWILWRGPLLCHYSWELARVIPRQLTPHTRKTLHCRCQGHASRSSPGPRWCQGTVIMHIPDPGPCQQPGPGPVLSPTIPLRCACVPCTSGNHRVCVIQPRIAFCWKYRVAIPASLNWPLSIWPLIVTINLTYHSIDILLSPDGDPASLPWCIWLITALLHQQVVSWSLGLSLLAVLRAETSLTRKWGAGPGPCEPHIPGRSSTPGYRNVFMPGPPCPFRA